VLFTIPGRQKTMKKAVGGCSIFIQKLIQWFFILGFLGVIFYVLLLFGSQGDTEMLVSLVIMGAIILFVLYRVFIRPARQKRKRTTVPASILRIDIPNNISQPILYHTKVIFESRGKRINITLTPTQVNDGFADKYAAGDTGMLTYTGDRMYDWVPPTPEKPMVNARHRTVFISYAHEWGEDAEYLAQFFRTAGLNVWHDKSQVRTGDRLTDRISTAIQGSEYFVPLLCQDYWNSAWCIQEFELAAKSGMKFIPIKVSADELIMPPHIKRTYRNQLGEPVYLDLRGRNPVGQLQDLARQMTA
jgi:hypothetical protein